ncbi:MAG: dTMP kinase, partial [Alphaproteobacteria bacterium]|nr:dTMP kinase [Alphaproteobacteria bacterium]
MTERDQSAGRFITFEGGEGSGKSTTTAALVTSLSASGLSVLATREPGGAPGAEHIRSLLVSGAVDRWDPMAEALLHFAARREHLEHTIRPALEDGTWVVCDRFYDSTMAYQGYGQGLGPVAVRNLQFVALGDFAPDLTIVLDIPPQDGLGREINSDASDETRYGRMGAEFHARVRDGFLAIAAAEPDRCVVIDAAQSLDDVQDAIW